MHTKPVLHVLLKWKITRPGSVITDVIRLFCDLFGLTLIDGMGVQKKNRTRFEYLGETFTWYVDDWHVRVYSDDKRFHVAYFTGDPWGERPHLKVIGQRFPGLEESKTRPVLLCLPPFVTNEWQNSLGSFVNALIRWSLRKTHKLKYYHPLGENENAG